MSIFNILLSFLFLPICHIVFLFSSLVFESVRLTNVLGDGKCESESVCLLRFRAFQLMFCIYLTHRVRAVPKQVLFKFKY